MNREELISVYNNTIDVVNNKESISKTHWYSHSNMPNILLNYDKNEISLVNTDTITTAINLSGQGKTCILNMASERKPGGGVKNGAMAQEECLFRCTDLFKTVTTDFYPLAPDVGLYTTNVMVVKDKDYNLLDNPIYVDCVTVPAINLNKVSYSDDEYETITENKIELMLNMAKFNNCDNLVLGAWGCGVYGNEPDYISKTFLKLINESGYHFNKIVFAIINDRNSVGNNYCVWDYNYN